MCTDFESPCKLFFFRQIYGLHGPHDFHLSSFGVLGNESDRDGEMRCRLPQPLDRTPRSLPHSVNDRIVILHSPSSCACSALHFTCATAELDWRRGVNPKVKERRARRVRRVHRRQKLRERKRECEGETEGGEKIFKIYDLWLGPHFVLRCHQRTRDGPLPTTRICEFKLSSI